VLVVLVRVHGGFVSDPDSCATGCQVQGLSVAEAGPFSCVLHIFVDEIVAATTVEDLIGPVRDTVGAAAYFSPQAIFHVQDVLAFEADVCWVALLVDSKAVKSVISTDWLVRCLHPLARAVVPLSDVVAITGRVFFVESDPHAV